MSVLRYAVVWGVCVVAAGSDWWESGVYRADVLLKDLARAIHPENSKLASHTPVYLRNVFTEV